METARSSIPCDSASSWFCPWKLRPGFLVTCSLPPNVKNVTPRDLYCYQRSWRPGPVFEQALLTAEICLMTTFAGRNQPMCLSLCSHEEWNQMQRQEDEVAISEQDLELIKERETAIRQLEVRARSCFLFDSVYLQSGFLSVIMRKDEMSCMVCILCLSVIMVNMNYSYDHIRIPWDLS